MKVSECCYFGAGMMTGMAMLAGGYMISQKMGKNGMRRKASTVTAMLADEAGHTISCMGKRLARKMRYRTAGK